MEDFPAVWGFRAAWGFPVQEEQPALKQMGRHWQRKTNQAGWYPWQAQR